MFLEFLFEEAILSLCPVLMSKSSTTNQILPNSAIKYMQGEVSPEHPVLLLSHFVSKQVLQAHSK